MGTERVLVDLQLPAIISGDCGDGLDLEAADQDGAAARCELQEVSRNELGADRQPSKTLLLPDRDGTELERGRRISLTFRTLFRLSDYLSKSSQSELAQDREDEARLSREKDHEHARAENRRLNRYHQIVNESCQPSPYWESRRYEQSD